MQQIEQKIQCKKQFDQHTPSFDPSHVLKQMKLIERDINKMKKLNLLCAELTTLASFETMLAILWVWVNNWIKEKKELFECKKQHEKECIE